MVEQRSPKPRAEGSSPSAPAKPLNAVFAAMAQSVERVLGKDEVGSSNLPSSSSGTSAGIQGTGAVAPVFCYSLALRRPLTGRAGKGYNGNRKTGSVQAMIELEAVPIAEVRRLASKFFDCRCQKSAGILCVFQDFLAKAGGKFAVKMRAAAIGTASYNQPNP